VAWFNPVTGERLEVKDFKSDRFTAEPPGSEQDWVLHIHRQGRKESMLRSYKFESRRILMQEIELNPKRTPFEIVQPAADSIPIGNPTPYEAKVTRETRATRDMMWLWTGEVSREGQGYRVLGTGAKGQFQVNRGVAAQFPAVLHLRLYGMNAVGKVYSLDRTYQISK
jgi:hypothetical protein